MEGVDSSLGKTAGKLERPVWQAALDSEITQAITRLPGSRHTKGYAAPGVDEEERQWTGNIKPARPEPAPSLMRSHGLGRCGRSAQRWQ
jgi:hypothetical protein